MPFRAIRCRIPRLVQTRRQRAVISLVCMELRGAKPRSAARPLQRRNGVEQRLRHAAVMNIRPAEQHRQREPCRSVTIWRLSRVRRDQWGWCLSFCPPFGRNGRTVHAGSVPVQLSGAMKAPQQRQMQRLPDASFVPIPQAPPAGNARAAPHLGGQQAPRDTAQKHAHGSSQRSAIRDTRPAAFGCWQGWRGAGARTEPTERREHVR